MAKDHSGKKKRAGISRRDFLKASGVTLSVPLALRGTVEAQAAATGKIAGPAKASLSLLVNGKKQTLQLEPRVTLLEALRDFMDLTGAKKVCDRGTCGSCTVILDGKPVYSCSILAIETQGQSITTVEGITGGQTLHPVQQAFVDNDAQQCGFCTPGFVVACKALLDENPNPTPEEVQKGLGGNLCRCGTYIGVRAAALQAAKTAKGGM